MAETLVDIVAFICRELATITGQPVESFTEQSGLIGSAAVVASFGFVELLLSVEDYANDALGFEFDWTSDTAMSEARSHFRTVGSLAQHLLELKSTVSA